MKAVTTPVTRIADDPEFQAMKARLEASFKQNIQAHGEPKVGCRLCNDYGWITETVDGTPRSKRCDCKKPLKIVFGCPAPYKNVTRADWKPRTELHHITEVMDQFVQGSHDLYLFGSVGAGKTLLASILAHELAALGRSAAFRDVPTLLDALRRSELRTPPDPTETEDLLSVPTRVDVLILDDAGADKGSDYGRRTLVMLYNARIAEKRRTIWTSNLDLETWSTQLGDDRLTSRVAGRAGLIEFDAPDYRVLGPKEWRR